MQYLTMKTSQLSLCFILLSIYTSSLLSAVADQPAPVLDIDGDELRAGDDYYILPAIRGTRGGLTLASTGNQTCPLSVVQEGSEVRDGLPLYFRPVNPKESVVRLSTDQNILFNASSVCVQTTLWNLDYEESTRKYVITTGGEEGNPGPETISNWFKIEASEIDYKLVFCPTVCDFCRPVCGVVGIFFQDGQRRLALQLDDDVAPFRVVFKKA